MSINIVAIAMARNEERIIGEGVRAALEWVDQFIVCDHGSTDRTAEIARDAGAVVIDAPPAVPFNEGLRQLTVEAARQGGTRCDWIIRIDVDEIYHWLPNPREVIAAADATGFGCVKAIQAEFWLTIDDVKAGLLLETDGVPVQKLRRWYTIGHPATVAWKDCPDLNYFMDVELQKRRNVPITPEGLDIAQMYDVYGDRLLQKHYNCQTLAQVMARMPDRAQDLNTFGKYRYNLIIDEKIGLYWLAADERFDFRPNHDLVYQWYEKSAERFRVRAEAFGWPLVLWPKDKGED